MDIWPTTHPPHLVYVVFERPPVLIKGKIDISPFNYVSQAPLSSTSQQSSTTPDSSTSNIMACLPEDCQPNGGGHLSNLNVNATPSPPPAPNPPSTAMSSTTAIYARVNPNLKRDKTNNNNFTSTFAPPLQVSTHVLERQHLTTSNF